MHFQLELFLGADIDMEFELSLEQPSVRNLVLRFNRVEEGKDKPNRNVVCAVLTEESPTAKVAQLLQTGSEPFPANVRSFADDLQGRLCEDVERVLRLFRWLRGGFESHNPVRAVGRLAYSADGHQWRPLQTTTKLNICAGIPRTKMSAQVRASVANLWRGGAEEPLAHDLLLEAGEQEHKNPRSCLVLGVAAAEVGFKQLVGRLVPDAKWMVDNVPSPPLEKMLAEYLPDLPAKALIDGVKPRVPQALIDTLKKAVNLRNQVVHGKAPKFSRDTLHEILVAIHDCLYLFDCYAGHRWAWNCITVQTQRLISKELAKDFPRKDLK